MYPFDYDSWRRSLDPTDQWLLDWRTQRNFSIRDIAKKSGLEAVAVVHRLQRLRERLIAQVAPTDAE